MSQRPALGAADYYPPKTANEIREVAIHARDTPTDADKIQEMVAGYTVTGYVTDAEKTEVTGTVVGAYFNHGETLALKVRVEKPGDISGKEVSLGTYVIGVGRITAVLSPS